ncbi:MAG: glycosyltransferase [Bacteroidota bacterium]
MGKYFINREIVFVTLRMTPPFFLGGAEISQRILAEKLVAHNFKVSCIGSYAHPIRNTWERLPEYCDYLSQNNIPFEFEGAGSNLSYTYNGIFCIMLTQENVMKYFIENNNNVQLVFTWLERSDEIIKYCNDNQINVATWIHDVLSVGLMSLQAGPPIILFTSEFVRQRVKKLYNLNGFVIYPPFELKDVNQIYAKNKSECKTITLINPIPEKGIKTFLELSTYFKDFTFLIVEGWRPVNIDDVYLNQNVRYVARQYDMNHVYAHTHILLVPSHFEEGFGRVVIEAGFYGVPSIVSNRGGLVEATGNGGIVVNSHDINEWYKAIKTVDDANNYKMFSMQAKANADLFFKDPVLELIDIGILKK